MTDLTVLLLSPSPLPGVGREQSGSPRFGHGLVHRNAVSRPSSPVSAPPVHQPIPVHPVSADLDSSLLSPPVNTWRSPTSSSSSLSRTRHSPQRSVSAPPACTTFEQSGTLPSRSASPTSRRRVLGSASGASSRRPGGGGIGELVRPPPPLRACLFFPPHLKIFVCF